MVVITLFVLATVVASVLTGDNVPKHHEAMSMLVVADGDEMLLIKDDKGEVSEGLWTPLKAELHKDEDFESAAIRAAKDVAGLTYTKEDLKLVGSLHWMDLKVKNAENFIDVHTRVFRVDLNADRSLLKKDDRLGWFTLSAIPWEDTWGEERLWFPWALEGDAFFTGETRYVSKRKDYESIKLTYDKF